MSKQIELPKAYEPKEHEDAIAQAERESGFYTPENLPGIRDKAFTIILPPPNATGTLHMGHAAMLAIEDIMIRFQRMRGRKALWLPGTDHAAIATQVKVENILQKEEGLSRFDLGREKFLNRVDKFVEGSRATINHQVREMGCSIDWTREAFTLDAKRNLAVRTMFKKMYDDGLIYRGNRVINWDPVGQTVISDDEIVHVERTAKLYTFKYGKNVPITIATTRPETKVGDTAIAVHPEGRWKKFIGEEYEVEFAGSRLKLKVVGDQGVDDSFGAGALGVTPAHSAVDAEMAKRHDLKMVQVIDENANMTDEAGPLVAGKTSLEAREIVVKWLESNNLLEKTEDISQNVSTAERTGAVIEPLPKLQWFIDVNKEFVYKASSKRPIAGLTDGQSMTFKFMMQHVVAQHEVSIIPDRFESTYFWWIDNLRDWCISRQLWYGHRIPAWYRGDEVMVGDEPSGDGWEQDEDTLDTWFSSGLWTFSTLGWPDEGASDLETFHPTTVLETGRDIIFFWVARMILMTTYALGEVPFKYVYLHGMVRDDQGRKMSKSLDNIIDPLEMKAQFGTDATRLSLVMGMSPGNDTGLSEEKIAGFRNFTNKLWNIARFVLMSVERVELVVNLPEPKTDADAWILHKLNRVIASVSLKLDEPQFALSQAGEELRDFTWGDFADWYLEVAKVQLADERLKASTEAILLYTLQATLKMWHPFMPFVTTKLWESFGSNKMLIVEDWPTVQNIPEERIAEVAYPGPGEGLDPANFERIRDIVTAIRTLRATYKIANNRKLNATVVGSKLGVIEEHKSVLRALGGIDELTIALDNNNTDDLASVVAGGVTVYISLDGLVDVTAEKARIQKELAGVSMYTASLESKLGNKGFTDNAPPEAVAKERTKLAEALARKQAMEDQLGALK